MKKMMICLFAIVMMALSACTDNNTFNVTVVKNEGTDLAIGGNKVMVVTESGDSLEAFISESLLFNNKLPFSTIMEKTQVGRYGFIRDTSSVDKYEVTVTEKIGYDKMVGGNKVIAITKSGMPIECFISDELLLKNKVPFIAKMSKSEEGRYGFIN